MKKKVLETIKKYKMIEQGDTLVIGLSGGIDSVCLLMILNDLKVELSFELYALHLHHGIRGEDADGDAQFVKALCMSLDIPCDIVYRNIIKEAETQKISVEEAGRIARYDLFQKKATELGQAKIAVAHHKNDQVETILHNIIRGSGLKGLGGIKPIRDQIIRPLYECSKDEIVAYCKANDIMYRDDYTNDEDVYTRNKIRLNLIPYIKEQYNPNIEGGLWQMSQMLREDEEYMQIEVEKAYQDIMVTCEQSKGIELSLDKLLKTHRAIRKRVYRKAFESMGWSLKNIEYKHMEIVDGLIALGTGKAVNLPGNIVAMISYDVLRISDLKQQENGFEYPVLHTNQEVYIKEYDKSVVVNVFKRELGKDFSKKIYTKWFDYDKIKYNLSIRTRNPGDYILFKGHEEGSCGKKKIKDYFIDNKVPRHMRDEIPLVADGDSILWIVGYRISEYYKVSNATTTILEIRFMEEQSNYGNAT